MFKSQNTARFAVIVLLTLTALLLSACAGTKPGGGHPAVDRAQERWDALAADDLEKAYSFYSPGYRSTVSLIDFGVSIRTKKVRWTSAEYLDHTCEESRCKIRFSLGFKVYNPVPGMSVYDGQQAVEDTWVKTQGQWWYLPNK